MRGLLALAFAVLMHGSVPAAIAAEAESSWSREPSVRELQRAAARQAAVEPERVRSWLRRVHHAALLPAVRLRVGRGLAGVQLTHGLDGIDRYATTASDTWRFEIEATWSLDRLVFDHNEIGLGRESQRIAARREQLLVEVAQLYFSRRRLQIETSRSAGDSAEARADRQLEIDELTAVLDGLSGGALSRGEP